VLQKILPAGTIYFRIYIDRNLPNLKTYSMRILIADDHGIIRKGLKQILLEEFPTAIIEEAVDTESVIQKAGTAAWDIVICDLAMPGRSGLDAVKHIKHTSPRMPVLILSIHPEREYALRALKAGAAGYISKDAANDELVKAIRRILQGRKYISAPIAEIMAEEMGADKSNKPGHESLSNREFDIFTALADGKSVWEIAEKFTLSTSTVSTYRARIFVKMNVKSNAELTRYAIEHKLV
jgi:DNA-binding NarL/FixJ family response regulator